MKRTSPKSRRACRVHKPLSPDKALQNEIRTLDRAQDKVLADAAREEQRRVRDHNRKWRALCKQQADLDTISLRAAKATDAAVTRALNQITSRRARLQARLAAL